MEKKSFAEHQEHVVGMMIVKHPLEENDLRQCLYKCDPLVS